ncbi:bifunctional diaminohydroxyphosphoribosylaminopyrimidine deaminase/5-amino-6-(5-phosphoribosylamino)uracil reductase RibD [Enemella sp. A6]|uniref:bifunctional diaminohydroxyphosphoribosylaminopyrimidine deaminase/5-amino-6-(5-phosphoribosylamino)uracil reductase RibD n=1 Tax=Enemella sp. A6 TaxID=3440152 RepID=UPI003EBAD375
MPHQPPTTADERWMRRALELAARGPQADPNPRVGCVLVDPGNDSEVAAGVHRGAGTPHAEADALAAAGDRARGCTAYVSLEPCSHTGRTGPCTEALAAAGVTRVVHGASDPNPAARGGADILRAHGIEVVSGVLAADAERLNEPWRFAVTEGRPMVTWKFAASLDGRSAAADGTSQWLTGPEARADVHRQRAECGAILVGTGTAVADDPQLTVRDQDGHPVGRQPLRVVAGLRDLPAGARLFDETAETLHLRTRDPHEVLAELHRRQVRQVWLEGGPTLAAAFWRARLIDRVICYFAPVMLGSGSAAVTDFGITTLADAPRFTLHGLTRLGDDVRADYRPVQEGI